jgi:2-keto-4-pentenoate hydratase
MTGELKLLAENMLADFDVHTPGRCAGELVNLTTEGAYALQAEIARLREHRGEQVIGYKVGCTSRAIQTQLGVDEPIFGRLFAAECHPSGVHLSSARFANLAVEGELAVRLGHDLSGLAVSAEECQEAIVEISPVIELHHYVLPEAWLRPQWLIASGGMHAGFVLAETERNSSGLTHRANRLSIQINEVVVGAVEDAASLTRPIESVRWLVGRLARFGLQLWKGQMILTGSAMPLFPVVPGSRIVVEAPPLGACCAQICP